MEMNTETVARQEAKFRRPKKWIKKSTFVELSTEEIQAKDVPVTRKKAIKLGRDYGTVLNAVISAALA